MDDLLNPDITLHTPQIKICGLKNMDEALACADLGADAIGFVFYPKSPRYVHPEQAQKICDILPKKVLTVGVFVNEPVETIRDIAVTCGLGAIQLHGNESPKFVEELKRRRLQIIKALYMVHEPSVENAFLYNATAFLVECQKDILPGGNAMTWKWEEASDFGEHYPFILAGGLAPDNVEEAVNGAKPDAVDVSSGVESSPGKKDMIKVKNFIRNVKKCIINKSLRRIFHGGIY
jgi:phosphoribosylanthranilate isomerase